MHQLTRTNSHQLEYLSTDESDSENVDRFIPT